MRRSQPATDDASPRRTGRPDLEHRVEQAAAGLQGRGATQAGAAVRSDAIAELDKIKERLARLGGAQPAPAAPVARLAPAAPRQAVEQRMTAPAARAPSPDDAGYESLRRELADIKAMLAGSSQQNQSGAFDRDALLRSIEEGYSAIAGRLENAISRHAAPPPGAQMAALSEQVSAVRDLLEQLPMRLPVESVEARLDELRVGLAELSGRGESGLGRHFRAIESRLEEVTRALVAFSVSPGAEPDTLTRIEARLGELSDSVAGLASGQGSEANGIVEAAAQALDAVAAQIADLSSRVEQIYELAAAGPVPEAGLHAIMEQLAAIEDRIAGGAAAGVAFDPAPLEAIERQISDFSARLDDFRAQTEEGVMALAGGRRDDDILAAINAVANRLEELPASEGGALPPAALRGVERRIEEVSKQIASLQPSARPFGATDHDASRHDELLAAIEQLSARMAGGQAYGLQEDGDRLGALEHTLERIATRLDEPAATGNYGIIAERLDSIEQQVLISRDFAIEAANQAAERVLQMAGQMSVQTQGGAYAADPSLVSSLAAELQGLESLAREMASRNDKSFAAVREVLDMVVARLDEMESAIGAGRIDLAMPPVQSAAAPRQRGADRPHEREWSGNPAMPAATLADSPEPRIEDDVPLEPGSGMPDLAALVRDASERRKSQAEAAAMPQGADFLAAARRAAQQGANAAPQPAKEQRKADAKPEKPKKSVVRLAALNGILTGRNKVLLAAVAAAALLAVGLPTVLNLAMGGGEPEIVEPAPDPASGPETPGSGATEPAETEGDLRNAEAKQADDAASLAEVEAKPAPTVGEDAAARTEEGAGPGTPGEAITAAPVPPEEVGNVALRQAAAAGNAEALFEIARRYTDGVGVPRDLAKAAEWYEESARAGSAPAQYRLANFLEKGHGVDVDVERAALWYQRAAEQGNALAMHNLGVLHASGALGGQPDMQQALGWFEKAGDLGVKDSQVNLGIIYAQGMGVEADLEQSYKWLSIAARGGDTDAGSKRDAVAKGMRPEQVERARAVAEAWKPGTIDAAANQPVVLPEWSESGEKAQALPGSPADPAPAAPAPVTPKNAEISRQQMISQVQTILTQMGYDPGPADGVMGQRTRDAVKAVQKQFGMKADGEITAELLEKLAGAV